MANVRVTDIDLDVLILDLKTASDLIEGVRDEMRTCGNNCPDSLMAPIATMRHHLGPVVNWCHDLSARWARAKREHQILLLQRRAREKNSNRKK